MNTQSPPGPPYLGLDLGGSKVLALVATADGQVLGEALLPTPASEGPARVVQVMMQAAQQATASAGVDPGTLGGAGVAAAGAIDRRRGVVVHSPQLAGLNNVPLVQMLQDHLRLPTVMDNDANLAALGEHLYGVGQGVDNLLFITLSTGIGGGIIIGGRLYRGGQGFAGEIGHISVLAGGPRGRSSVAGALEALASGSALAGEVSRRLREGEPSLLQEHAKAHGADSVTAELVFEAYHQGDELARKVVTQAVVYLGAGLTSLVNVLDPELLIIGGGLANQWEPYIAPAVEIMRAEAMAGMGRGLRVVPAALGARAGALGAVALASGARGVNRKGISTMKTTTPGYENRNGQIVVRNTGKPGTDHFQYVYELKCRHCSHRYGANGSDIFERKCPNPKCPEHQNGKQGIPIVD